MPSYRGVGVEDIKDSARRAVARLRALDLGDATREMLDLWEAMEPYNQLDMARTDEELAILMNVSGTKNIFTCMDKVFAYHGAMAARGEGEASDETLYRDLAAWGAFVPDMPEDRWHAVRDEATQYMLAKCLDRLEPDDCEEGSPAYEIFKKAIADVKKQDPGAEKWFEKSVELYVGLHALKQDGEIAALLDEKPNVINFLITTLYKMTGLKAEEEKMGIDHPLREYHVTVPFPPATAAGKAGSAVNEDMENQERAVFSNGVRDRLLDQLEPFFATDQATAKIKLDEMTPDSPLCSVFFLATRNAAQAVADNLTQYKVFDAEERSLPSVRRRGPRPPEFGP